MSDSIEELIHQFSQEVHGKSDYSKEVVFVMGKTEEEYAPLSYLVKNNPETKSEKDLQSLGYMYSSYTYLDEVGFSKWFQNCLGVKLTAKKAKEVGILYSPDNKKIFDAISLVHKAYKVLRDRHVVMNGKNLPIQMGEWYAKSIFGLKQIKSSSQRGFDFYDQSNQRVEVKIHWSDTSSPKGVKLKKSLLVLSRSTIIMYVGRDFMIRDVLYLDSDFILRKFGGKGYVIFIKDADVFSYFFSRSSSRMNHIVNRSALMRFANPALAMKLADRI